MSARPLAIRAVVIRRLSASYTQGETPVGDTADLPLPEDLQPGDICVLHCAVTAGIVPAVDQTVLVDHWGEDPGSRFGYWENDWTPANSYFWQVEDGDDLETPVHVEFGIRWQGEGLLSGAFAQCIAYLIVLQGEIGDEYARQVATSGDSEAPFSWQSALDPPAAHDWGLWDAILHFSAMTAQATATWAGSGEPPPMWLDADAQVTFHYEAEDAAYYAAEAVKVGLTSQKGQASHTRYAYTYLGLTNNTAQLQVRDHHFWSESFVPDSEHTHLLEGGGTTEVIIDPPGAGSGARSGSDYALILQRRSGRGGVDLLKMGAPFIARASRRSGPSVNASILTHAGGSWQPADAAADAGGDATPTLARLRDDSLLLWYHDGAGAARSAISVGTYGQAWQPWGTLAGVKHPRAVFAPDGLLLVGHGSGGLRAYHSANGQAPSALGVAIDAAAPVQCPALALDRNGAAHCVYRDASGVLQHRYSRDGGRAWSAATAWGAGTSPCLAIGIAGAVLAYFAGSTLRVADVAGDWSGITPTSAPAGSFGTEQVGLAYDAHGILWLAAYNSSGEVVTYWWDRRAAGWTQES